MKTISLVSTAVTGVGIMLVTACGSGGSGGSGSAASSALTYAQAACDYVQRCSPGDITAEYGDVATCVSDNQTLAAMTLSLPGVTATSEQVDACIATIRTLDCNVSPDEVAQCNYTGSLASGNACADGTQCASGYCQRAATTTGTSSGVTTTTTSTSTYCGHCADRGDIGALCPENGACKAGLGCDFSTQRCATRPAKGAACTGQGVQCASGYTCISGVCTDPIPAGGACGQDGDGCAANLECVDSKCAAPALTFAKVGEACGADPTAQTAIVCAQSSCRDTGAQNVPTCVPNAKEGEACGSGASAGPSGSPPPDCDVLLHCDDTTSKCVKDDPASCK